VRFYKSDRTNITKFRIRFSEVRKEFQNLDNKLYTDMQEFQKIASHITSLLDKAKMKNYEFIKIRMDMDEMKKWAEENLDAYASLLRMTIRES